MLLLIVVSLTVLLTGCMSNGNLIGIIDYYYNDLEKYTIGQPSCLIALKISK